MQTVFYTMTTKPYEQRMSVDTICNNNSSLFINLINSPDINNFFHHQRHHFSNDIWGGSKVSISDLLPEWRERGTAGVTGRQHYNSTISPTITLANCSMGGPLIHQEYCPTDLLMLCTFEVISCGPALSLNCLLERWNE